MPKVTHDATNRLIIVTEAPVGGLITIDVLSELYSESKRAWLADLTLNRLKFPWLSGGRHGPGHRGKQPRARSF